MKHTHFTTLLATTALLLVPVIASAQGFVSLSNIPGVTQTGISFNDFLNGAFKFGLAIAATLAVVMITIGGVEYMGRDSYASKEAGRERITNAIIGLIIALLIWVILFTINPNLLNFNININKAGTSSGSSSGSSAVSAQQRRDNTTSGFAGENAQIQQAQAQQQEDARRAQEVRDNTASGFAGENEQIRQQQKLKEGPFGSTFKSSADAFKNFRAPQGGGGE